MPLYAKKHAPWRMFFRPSVAILVTMKTCPKNLSGATPAKVAESSALFRNIAMHKRRFLQAHSSSCSRIAMDYTFRRLNLGQWWWKYKRHMSASGRKRTLEDPASLLCPASPHIAITIGNALLETPLLHER